MRPSDVEALLAEIEHRSFDSEDAHGLEDEMRASVLKAIADGSCEDPAKCAALALSSAEIKFERWYA